MPGFVPNWAANSAVYVVKAYGAVGNGSVDDTASIQAAIDACIATGGSVYFPLGNYKITSPLIFTSSTGHSQIRLIGERAQNISFGSTISGNFNNYLLDSTNSSYNQVLADIQNLDWINSHATGKCVNFFQNTTGEISNCFFQGHLCVRGYAANLHIRSCSIQGDGTAGSIGVLTWQTVIEACSLTSCATAVKGGNAGLNLIGNRFEVNDTAILIGVDENDADYELQGGNIVGNSFESNNTGIYVAHAAGLNCSGNMITANNQTGGGITVFGKEQADYGIRIGAIDSALFAGLTIAGRWNQGGIVVDNQPRNTVFSGVLVANAAGDAWVLPAWSNTNNSFACVSCNNPTLARTVASLPSSPIEGMEFDVSDGTDSLAWGATVTNTGSHTTHYKVRYNGANWTVVGK